MWLRGHHRLFAVVSCLLGSALLVSCAPTPAPSPTAVSAKPAAATAAPAQPATPAATTAPAKPAAAPAQPSGQKLVVSIWGGNWKDAVEKVVAPPFTQKTGAQVEFEVGGTIDRLAKARVAKGNPLVDVTFTTTHVGRLYISDGLFEKLDQGKLANMKELHKEGIRSDFHLGLWSYVYTVAYRTDQIKADITKWADLWNPELQGKVAVPDFDPSHIIVVAARMSGGDEFQWQKGQERLMQLKPNLGAFFATDAQSQDLMKTGQAPVQVMLSVNGAHLIDQGVPLKLVKTQDFGGVVGIDTVGIHAGSKNLDLAHQFVDLAMSREIQEELVKTLKVGPTNSTATVPAELRDLPGVFTSPEQWQKEALFVDDEQRARALNEWKEWFTANIVK
jgi:putative spermidine/putrescine transport system substrate-binding protein